MKKVKTIKTQGLVKYTGKKFHGYSESSLFFHLIYSSSSMPEKGRFSTRLILFTRFYKVLRNNNKVSNNNKFYKVLKNNNRYNYRTMESRMRERDRLPTNRLAVVDFSFFHRSSILHIFAYFVWQTNLTGHRGINRSVNGNHSLLIDRWFLIVHHFSCFSFVDTPLWWMFLFGNSILFPAFVYPVSSTRLLSSNAARKLYGRRLLINSACISPWW